MNADPKESSTRASPRSLRELFWFFSLLALQGFGGVMAIAQRELVERRGWLTREQFLAEWSVAHVLPGPNIVNLGVMLGERYFGVRGALAAVAGLLTLPLVIVLLLAWAFGALGAQPAVAAALKGVAVAVAALIAATACKLLPALSQHPAGLPFCAVAAAATLLAVVHWRLPLPSVLLGVGGVAVGWTWVKLRQG
ncbi:chromate transporter [Caldimonas tepidiphila]|uniref:chromate transporter n=1 Tax=Caldimonas tepidiphila TaxID=2315841 RepID=UPI000E5BAE64|nr:chromate transporter [Caldimonas tepidiphila]